VIALPFGTHTPTYDSELSKQLLSNLGWQPAPDGMRAKKLKPRDKQPTPLQLSLIALEGSDEADVAVRISDDLRAIGIDAVVKLEDLNEFTNRLTSGSFQLALVAEIPLGGPFPDLSPFFSSREITPAGMNISAYRNTEADTIFDRIAASSDSSFLPQAFDDLATVFASDSPAAFLYRPLTTWIVSPYLHAPAMSFINGDGDRVARINEWYLYTKRVWTK
jgi:peptide/nickel transport system substrate-binding protein